MNRRPLYSLLIGEDEGDDVEGLLRDGIKVISFSETTGDRPEHAAAGLYMHYPMAKPPRIRVVDGDIKGKEEVFSALCRANPRFNSEQYLIEHADPGTDMIVTASAGTGKTKVMIDRVLFLIHTVPGLRLTDIGMVTFTNDAADNMDARLRKALADRFRLTGDRRYIRFLEEQSCMEIGTIHSFELDLLRRYGAGIGLSSDVSVRTFRTESRDIADRSLDGMVGGRGSVSDQLGSAFFNVRDTAVDFWRRLSGGGYTREQIMEMDWGNADKEAGRFQDAVRSVITGISEDLKAEKRRSDCVSLSDMQCDVEDAIAGDEKGSGKRFIFVDEFQDTDDCQIRILCRLRSWGSRLFAVGDVKQSIYRFRGATDKAFDNLRFGISNMGLPAPKEFELVINYRSSPYVLKALWPVFRNCYRQELLDPFPRPVAFNNESGFVREIEMDTDEPENQIVEHVSYCLQDLRRRKEGSGTAWGSSDRVAVLVRTNSQLDELAYLLESRGVPIIVNRGGSFYRTQAVSDLRMAVESFVYKDDPVSLWNYLESPYSGYSGKLRVSELEKADADRGRLLSVLRDYLEWTPWKLHSKVFSERPLIAALTEFIEGSHVIDNRMHVRMEEFSKYRVRKEDVELMALADVRRYKANLDKLMRIVIESYGKEFHDLYGMCRFLERMAL
ncbi:MAG: ATP-dependent helicase, partial [archaeon]|nr:ATP-dependent helicase [archaeon]